MLCMREREEPQKRLGAAGNALVGGNFCWGAPCRKPEGRDTRDPTLRPRSRVGGNTPPDPTRPTRPSVVGTADFRWER